MFPAQLRSGKLRLRELRQALDPAQYLGWASERELRAARTRELVLPEQVSPGVVPQVFAAPRTGGARYAVLDGTGRLRGVAGLAARWRLRRADVGVQATPEAWRGGTATDALGALFRYALGEAGFEVAVTGHLSGRSLESDRLSALVEERGGVREGAFSNWVVVDDRPRELVRYAVRDAEWVSPGGGGG